jgi:hypothetical protein
MALDELIADYALCTCELPGETSVTRLLEWSRLQTVSPERTHLHGCLAESLRVARGMGSP